MKKIIKLVLALSLFVLCSCQKKATLDDDVYIFYTSDTHCGYDQNIGFAGLSAMIKDAKEEHKYVLLVDDGDYAQGEAIGSFTKGVASIELMNDVGYDIATFGNHEFDYGMDGLAKLISLANFDLVATNVKYSGDKQNVFADVPEYIIKEFNGVKIAFLGVLTPEAITSSTPKNFMENDKFVYNFYSDNKGQDLYDKVQSVTDEARKDGAQYVIALTHLGSAEANVPYDSISLIHNTSGIDVVIDGHSHSTIVEDKYPNKNNEDVILTSVGTKLQSIGQLIIGKDGSITAMQIDEYAKKDEEIIKKIEEKNEELSQILSQKVSDLEYDMMIFDEENIRMSRNRETTVADFAADAFKYVSKADIGLATGGGNARANIEAGEVTFGDLMAITPFQNDIITINATGQQIVDALEYASRFTESIYKFDGNPVGEFGGFFIPSGLRYTIDTSIESSAFDDENNMFAGFSNDNRRVKNVEVLENGEYVPIDLEKTYTVSSSEYSLIGSGDGNTVFKDCEVVDRLPIKDVEVLKKYLDDIGGFGDLYSQIANRIIIE